MSLSRLIFVFIFSSVLVVSCFNKSEENKTTKVWLVGDSTMANYALEDDYMQKKYPITGWGQVFQSFMSKDSIELLSNIIQNDSVVVDDRARGGRSTRTFFEEGRWRYVYENIQPGDLVLIQFGHNDGAKTKPARYVNIEGYKEFLRLFVNQTRQKKGIPVLLTPVARNYPWCNGQLGNVHKGYPAAMLRIAEELDVYVVDLNQKSMRHFSTLGHEYVSEKYFMNLPAQKYQAYPDGQNDNTHFQPEGAKAVAQLVFDGLKEINDTLKQ